MTTVYITESNFSKIAMKNLRDINDDITQVCRRVYESRNIATYLNHREIKFIECKRLLLENTEECIHKHIERIDAEKKNKSQAVKYSPYVFVSNTFIVGAVSFSSEKSVPLRSKMAFKSLFASATSVPNPSRGKFHWSFSPLTITKEPLLFWTSTSARSFRERSST